ncbi:lipid-A-disaccharide synthase [Actibacterium mucosum KCTC 23349]|uniref:Lipid-A-disaccharide synthase n=1 Tax=Actibacterium mucosum KCTC 23349 TaxID=1454373 RepID=A0A037ZMS8_9RHOB|nr:lipid-A-disaccharide synthase [Actibacterium mucosum]KAJ56868.1 lipid-A-disaccharide synthase [Actibacterium mucosum KCTC 23349]
MKTFFLVAGEPSGDALGAALMAGLKDILGPQVRFLGVGGPLMQAEGMRSLFPMEELSLMGLAEVLPKYPHLVRRKNQTADAAIEARPDALITIDSPDFGLRVAKRVKANSDIRTIHYVAPTVWAWRAGRARKMAAMIDQVLALFPFEPPYMEAEGMRCDFVGHPIATQAEPSDADISALREKLGLSADRSTLLVLPGSRKGEVGRLSPVFGEALTPVLAAHPKLQILVPAAPSVTELVQDEVKSWPGTPVVLDTRGMEKEAGLTAKRSAFALADFALAASGTVSLELAAAGTPMVIGYDMNWISREIIMRMIKVNSVNLVNIVTGSQTVPEFIGVNCKPDAIGASLTDLVSNPDQGAAQRSAMAEAMEKLGKGGTPPGRRAAQAVLDGL